MICKNRMWKYLGWVRGPMGANQSQGLSGSRVGRFRSGWVSFDRARRLVLGLLAYSVGTPPWANGRCNHSNPPATSLTVTRSLYFLNTSFLLIGSGKSQDKGLRKLTGWRMTGVFCHPGRSYMVGTGWILYVPSCSWQPDSGRFFDGRIPVCSGAFQSEPTGNSSEFVRWKTGRNPVVRNMKERKRSGRFRQGSNRFLRSEWSTWAGKSYASLFILYTVFSCLWESVCNVCKKIFDEGTLFSFGPCDCWLEQLFRVLFCFWEVGYPMNVFHWCVVR